MNFAVVLSFFLGFFGVLQAALNKQISLAWGLGRALFFNSIVIAVMALLFLYMTKPETSPLPEIYHNRGAWTDVKLWYFIPAFFGFYIVGVIPYTFQQLGALKTMLIIIAAQIVVGMFWDLWVEKIPVTLPRVLGSLLTFVGVLLTMLRRS